MPNRTLPDSIVSRDVFHVGYTASARAGVTGGRMGYHVRRIPARNEGNPMQVVLVDVPNLLLVIALPIAMLLVLFAVTYGIYRILAKPFPEPSGHGHDHHHHAH